jgi:hypothetical protein
MFNTVFYRAGCDGAGNCVGPALHPERGRAGGHSQGGDQPGQGGGGAGPQLGSPPGGRVIIKFTRIGNSYLQNQES